MLRGLMAVSADGYVCTGPRDDMRWTGSADKRLFREQTMGCVVGVGSTTAALMPPLPGRTLVRITREAEGQLPIVYDGASMALGAFARACPDAWLIGGQTVLLAAIEADLVGCVVLSHVRAETGGGWKDLVTPRLHALGWRGRLFPQDELSLVTWNRP